MICIDELGPLSAKTYVGEQWHKGPKRGTFEPDYGRRGNVWVHGAFEPATGQASILVSEKRDGAAHIQLLEQVIRDFPSERLVLIQDNLIVHSCKNVQTALLAWPEIRIQFIPKYACWLNLIEPWWKQLRSLALKGKRFETVEEVKDSLIAGCDYWNAYKRPYKWKKQPQIQPEMLLGGYGTSMPGYKP